jgi:diguanylate cyclase (GGDEF)-like protein
MDDERGESGLIGWINCQDGNLFGCFLRKCLDTNITGKLLGFLVVSLVGIGLLITVNFLTIDHIQKLHHNISSIQIPQYKISQYILRSINGFKISLMHIMEEEDLNLDDRDVIANQERLANMEMMILAMKNGGSILDVAKVSQKTLDVFSVSPSKDPILNALNDEITAEFYILEESFNELVDILVSSAAGKKERQEGFDNLVDSLDEMHQVISRLAIEINNRNNADFAESNQTIHDSQFKSIIIGLVVAVLLVSGSILYMLLIVSPLKDITAKIKDIASGDSDQSKRIDVKTHDEIGVLAQHLNKLIDNIYKLNTFKAVIEEEETTKEVNNRLSAVLHDKYDLDQIFIYETSSNKNNMTIAYASDPENVCSSQILDDSNFCRAKRTGHPVSSFQYPDICKIFPNRETMEHHCIPMIANGRVVGIVQFIHDKVESEETLVNFESRVKGAVRYIEEATPVIEAKRFASALQETTLRDPMTDLYNRRFLETYSDTLVASTMRRGTKVGVMMCDMDFFKEVNDNFGHETGDIVLVKTAEVLKNCVRASDMVIRYGGEEFLILLIDIKDKEDIIELAERIRSSMESTSIKHPEGTLNKTISIGYSEFPDDSDGFWEAIKFADVALYRAKAEGRNRVVGFTADMWESEDY